MPLFKKSGSSIFGCQFNKKEQAAMEQEIRRQLAEWDRKNTLEIDAMFLWFMHEEFGFGEKRLRQIYDGFAPYMKALEQRYEMKPGESPFLCTKKLLDYGINLEKWENELDKLVASEEKM